jgi:hypothetical protein
VARIHECSLKGIELVAFNLFRVFSGIDGPGCELEFHSQPNNKARWMKLARHILGLSGQSWLKEESRPGQL